MWITIILTFALVALAPQQAAEPPSRIDRHWLYVRDALKWEAPPKGTTEGVRHCDNAFLAVLFPSGEYVGVFPVLYRDDKTKHISISRGDGAVIRRGHWKKDTDGLIRITSSVVYSPVPRVGRNYPYDEKDEEWRLSGHAEGRLALKLITPKVVLVPLENFTDLDFLSKYIAVEGTSGAPTPSAQ